MASSILVGGVVASAGVSQSPDSLFRSVDGTGNHRTNIDWGRAGAALLRATRTSYADGRSAPAGIHRPSARAISNVVAAQTGDVPNRMGASSMLWQWGQFLDHDLVATETDRAEPFPIAVPRGDPWFDPTGTGLVEISMSRSEHVSLGQAQIRQQVNSITAFIDASMVYGSDIDRLLALIDAEGLLRTSPGDLMPFNTDGFDNAPSRYARTYFLGGDVRANEQVGLIAMHTLFLREHNHWARQLREAGVDPILSFQVARAIVGAEIQAITYREFLPVLLGPGALRPYRGYRPDVRPDISNEFATAAYRLGHSMLAPQILRLDARGVEIAAGHLALRDAFFAPEEVVAYGIEPILRGLTRQRAQEVDVRIVDDVRNFLFGAPGAAGFDLAALNIQRGRDHGLPSYAEACRDVGRPAPRRFADISSDPEVQRRLREAYGDVGAIDLWVGGLAEDHVPGAMIGPLFHRLVRDQFERLRDGDRFFYGSWLPPELVRLVESRTLARVIRDNTTIDRELSDDVFVAQPARRRR